MITNTLQTIYENPVLQEIYRGTIRAHRAKAGYNYPTIHLPVAFSGLIGLRCTMERWPFLWLYRLQAQHQKTPPLALDPRLYTAKVADSNSAEPIVFAFC